MPTRSFYSSLFIFLILRFAHHWNFYPSSLKPYFTIFFLKTLPTPQRLSRFCFSGCRHSCLKSRKAAAWQNESKRWGSIPFHSILTSPSAFWRPNRCSLPGFYISLISCINLLQSNKSNKIKGIKDFWKHTPIQIAPNFPREKSTLCADTNIIIK